MALCRILPGHNKRSEICLKYLTHRGRVKYICAKEVLFTIGSNNGLLPLKHQSNTGATVESLITGPLWLSKKSQDFK